jgi:hypothetical protein
MLISLENSHPEAEVFNQTLGFIAMLMVAEGNLKFDEALRLIQAGGHERTEGTNP